MVLQTLGVVRDDQGQLLAALARHIYKNGNNMAELRAIHEGLTLVHKLGYPRVYVKVTPLMLSICVKD